MTGALRTARQDFLHHVHTTSLGFTRVVCSIICGNTPTEPRVGIGVERSMEEEGLSATEKCWHKRINHLLTSGVFSAGPESSAASIREGVRVVLKFVPRDEKFFDQIEQLSALTKSSAELLSDLVGRFPEFKDLPDQLAKAREDAAHVMQESLRRLDDAFITPLDREDIMQLITDLYDVIKKIADVAQRFCLYRLKELHPNLRFQSDTLRKVATVLAGVTGKLRDEKKLKELGPQLDEIYALEKQASANRDQFLSELFKGSPDPLEVMKKKELHDLLESAIWNCESVTRTLGRVLLKNG